MGRAQLRVLVYWRRPSYDRTAQTRKMKLLRGASINQHSSLPNVVQKASHAKHDVSMTRRNAARYRCSCTNGAVAKTQHTIEQEGHVCTSHLRSHQIKSQTSHVPHQPQNNLRLVLCTLPRRKTPLLWSMTTHIFRCRSRLAKTTKSRKNGTRQTNSYRYRACTTGGYQNWRATVLRLVRSSNENEHSRNHLPLAL